MRLVLVGPPGAGKGTQAVRMAERLDVPHISTGDLFRANLKEQTELGVQAQKYMGDGKLVPDEVTIAMVRERFTEPDVTKGFILDGFPRTAPQAEALQSLLDDHGLDLDVVVEFSVADEVVVQRLLSRGRDDDVEHVIRERQQVYRDDTAPLLEYYRGKLVSVDAVGTVDEVTERVFDALPDR